MSEGLRLQTWGQFYAGNYDLGMRAANLGEHAPLFAEISRTKPKRVLEVGIGLGDMTLFLASHGIEAVGLDNDAEVLAGAARIAKGTDRASFVLGDAFDLAALFKPAHFDVAFSQGLFEHFDDERIQALVAQQLLVARRVVFSVPSDEYPVQDYGNERLMGPKRWLEVLCSFGDVEACYYGTRYFGLRASLALKLRGKLTQPRYHVLVTFGAQSS